MRPLLRLSIFSLVRFFYREVAVSGAPPRSGPVILVANHPNGLVDPAILRVALDRSVAFLAKSTLFANPVGHYVMTTFDALPVYRAKEADTAQNDATFARSHAILREGGWLALFPEGISHDFTTLQPLKTGAARIALSSRVPGLQIVPVGILYEDKEIFRSRVALAFGAPIEVPAGDPEDPATVRALTGQISDALGELVLQAENQELLRGFVAVARWSTDGDLAAVDRRARALAEAWRDWSARDPERVASIVERVRHFVRVLEAVGITDPLALDEPPRSPLRTVLPLLLLAPVALVGAALAWVPYRLVRPLSERLAGGHTDLIGTFKAVLGAQVLGVTWLLESALAAWVNPWLGLAIFLLAPICARVALWWGEQLDLRREALHAGWLTANRTKIAAAVSERRQALVAEIDAMLKR